MRLLLVSIGAIAALGTIWALLTRQPHKVPRRWSWRRIWVRTLDRFIVHPADQKLLALIFLSPFTVQLAGYGRSKLGWVISILISVILVMIVGIRAGKWMTRASRPMDEIRQRYEDQVLSDEYRSTGKKQRN